MKPYGAYVSIADVTADVTAYVTAYVSIADVAADVAAYVTIQPIT